MKPEVKGWWNKAKRDLDTAKYLYDGKKYEESSLFCQQAIEKALKALLLKKTGKIRKIHDLIELGKDTGLPTNLLNNLKELTLAYIYSRYPDTEQEPNLKEKLPHFLGVSEEILKWVEENL